MAVPKDQRTVLQTVPTKVLGTGWRTVAPMAHLTAHSRDLQTAAWTTAFGRARKMVVLKALWMAWLMAQPMAQKMAEP